MSSMTSVAPQMDLSLLLIDDEEVIHQSLGRYLETMGYRVLRAFDGKDGLQQFLEHGADIIISDISMPDMDGIQLLRQLNQRAADVEVILITGYGDMDTAIQAMREGAFDFFTKPVTMEDLIASLERTKRYQAVRREKERIQKRLEVLMAEGAGQAADGEIIGESAAIRTVLDMVGKVAAAERTTVLITGESGTGKELVARAVHRRSTRAEGPFISVNCTAIPENLFESELFGHEKGAFTDARSTRHGMLELGSGGVVFLDEIGDMSAAAQAKILRSLEERCIRRVGGAQEIPVDIRLVTATNQPLRQLVQRGDFREDLYFRLNVFTIDIPPLRDRGDDVLLLAYHFLQQFAAEFRKNIEQIDTDVRRVLTSYPFPGNVRELRNIIERAVILCEGDTLTMAEFADLARSLPGATPEQTDDHGADMTLNLGELEEQAIRTAMRQTDNNQTDAARLLGIGHDALRYRIRKYGID